MSEEQKEGKIPMPKANFQVPANKGSHVRKMIGRRRKVIGYRPLRFVESASWISDGHYGL